jgi:hypothetical protein
MPQTRGAPSWRLELETYISTEQYLNTESVLHMKHIPSLLPLAVNALYGNNHRSKRKSQETLNSTAKKVENFYIKKEWYLQLPLLVKVH